MAHLMLMNPIGKKKKRKRRKLTALQAKYFGKRRGKKAKSRTRAKSTSSIPSRGAPVAKKRRRRSRKFKTNPIRHHRRRYRRNPIGAGGFINNSLMPAAMGAAGAIGLNFVLSKLPFGQNSSALESAAISIAGAVGLGYAVGMVAGKSTGEAMAAGALTVVMYNLASGLLGQSGAAGGQQAQNGQSPGMSQGMSQGMSPGMSPAGSGMGRYLGRAGRMRRGGGVAGMGAGPRRRRRRMGALPSPMMVGAPRNLRPVGMPPLNGMRGLGWIGPAPTMGRYLQPR